MNIFILDYDIEKSASFMCDKHIVKMMTEHNQMLSTAYRHFNGRPITKIVKGKVKKYQALKKEIDDVVYQTSHINHPCNVWLRKSKHNYKWLYDYNIATIKQYKRRYDKTPKCENDGLLEILKNIPDSIPDIGLTDFALAMPDHHKTNDTVQSYRNYYISDKKEIAKWKNTEPPYWWPNL
jgi:hypothetical protein